MDMSHLGYSIWVCWYYPGSSAPLPLSSSRFWCVLASLQYFYLFICYLYFMYFLSYMWRVLNLEQSMLTRVQHLIVDSGVGCLPVRSHWHSRPPIPLFHNYVILVYIFIFFISITIIIIIVFLSVAIDIESRVVCCWLHRSRRSTH